VTSAWNDLRRPPLRGVHLAQLLGRDGWLIQVVQEIGSTQEAVRQLVGQGAPAGSVVIAEHQQAGRGRRDRSWVSPPRAGVTMSILLRPERISPWSGFAVALAAAEAINEIAANPVRLKWPNDLLLNDSKVGGVIAEVEGSAVIVGLGLNVTTTREELPVDTATSLALEGVEIDREILIRSILRTLGAVLRRDDEELRADYLALLDTIGKRVRVEGVSAQFEGVAERVDQDGQLVVDGRSFAVGDVVHLR